jgi:hypothetical protein
MIVSIFTIDCTATAPACKINYKIKGRISCKAKPIWYMVLIFENDDRQPNAAPASGGLQRESLIFPPRRTHLHYLNLI